MTSPTFSAQLLGQTEKAANAILFRLLGESDLSEPQWITLQLIVTNDGSVKRDRLVRMVAGALKVTEAEAQVPLAELAARELVDASDAAVTLTQTGQQVHAGIRTAVAEITQRLWGDLPEEDLAAAGRVLSAVLARADAELAKA
jgi:hypothetical protein